jgi:hypothetical protein
MLEETAWLSYSMPSAFTPTSRMEPAYCMICYSTSGTLIACENRSYLSPNDGVERIPGGLKYWQAQPINGMLHVSSASSLFFTKERASVSSLIHQSNHCETFFLGPNVSCPTVREVLVQSQEHIKSHHYFDPALVACRNISRATRIPVCARMVPCCLPYSIPR